ncbi:MAG TPA: OadG family protein [Thermoanaerobacterales bacterium]|nr:OadG family protein [Thermoanaerobacterales bacterium]
MKIDKLLFGLQVTIIGMGIVFFILYIISYIIDLTKSVFNDHKAHSTDKLSIVYNNSSIEEHITNDEQLIAVITAAIAYTLNKPTSRFRVTKIVRYNQTTPIWGMSSRLNTRFERGTIR